MDSARLMILVLKDVAKREYAYGPANVLPDTRFGTFSQSLMGKSQKEQLDRDQHEGRVEADFCC